MRGSPALAAAVAAIVFVLHVQYLWPGGPLAHSPDPLPLVRDESTALYDSYRITQGSVMYRDFFEFQGPAFYYLNAAWFRLVGPSYTAARLLFLIENAVAAGLLAVLVARFAGVAAGLGAAAIHAFAMFPVWPLAYAHWLAELFGLAGLLFLTRARARGRDAVLGGALLGVALAAMQTTGLTLLAAAIVASALPGASRRDLRATLSAPARVLAGALIATLPWVIGFTASGGLGRMAYDLFVWPPTHYPAGQEPGISWTSVIGTAIREHHAVPQPWRMLAGAGLMVAGMLPWLAIAAAATAVIRIIVSVRRREPDLRFAVPAFAGLAAMAPVLMRASRHDLTHVVFVGGFALAGAAAALGTRAGSRPVIALALPLLFYLCGFVAAANYVAKSVMTWPESRRMSSWRGETLRLPWAEEIASRTRRGDRIVVGEMAGFYYFFIAPAAVSFTYLPVWLNGYYDDAQWRTIADEVATRRPRLMLINALQAWQMAKHRPELMSLYREDGPFLVLQEPEGR